MIQNIQKYKQDHFHRHKRIVVKHAHRGALHISAWVLTFSALLSFAKMIHHDYLLPQHYASSSPRIEKTAHSEVALDIGLRVPNTSSG